MLESRAALPIPGGGNDAVLRQLTHAASAAMPLVGAHPQPRAERTTRTPCTAAHRAPRAHRAPPRTVHRRAPAPPRTVH
eukprot:3654102-Prymnesium_polylepis.1